MTEKAFPANREIAKKRNTIVLLNNGCLDILHACRTFRVPIMFVLLAFLLGGCASLAPSPPDRATVTAVSTTISWDTLQQRPVHFPSLKPGTSCPTTHGSVVIPHFGPLLGKGPAYADFFGGKSPTEATQQGILYYASSFGDGSQWGGQKVIWFIDPSYHGPVLIRAGQLDGTHQVRFNQPPQSPGYSSTSGAQSLLPQLRLIGGGAGKPWPNWDIYTRLQAPGCYAYQIDGLGFSYLVIFKAVPS